MKNNYLSEREMNVMQVLWKYEKPIQLNPFAEILGVFVWDSGRTAWPGSGT